MTAGFVARLSGTYVYILVPEVFAPKLVTCCSEAAEARPLSASAELEIVLRRRMVLCADLLLLNTLQERYEALREHWTDALI